MEGVLKEILEKLNNLERKTDTSLANLERKTDTGFANLERKTDTGLANLERKTDTGFASINDKIELLSKGNKEEFRQLNKKIDGITEVVAKTMEDIVDLKGKVEKQDVEIRVIKGGAANA